MCRKFIDIHTTHFCAYKPWLHQKTWPTSILLNGTGIGKIVDTFRGNLTGLEWLVMDDNHIEVIPANAFEYLSDLTYLSLSNNQISQFKTDAFRHLFNLQVIDVDSNPIIPEYFETSVFTALPALKRLYLRNSNIRAFDLPGNMDNLTHLHLSYNEIQIFHAKSKSALTNLYLNNNQLQYVSVSHFESLVYLDLSSNWLRKIVSHATNPFSYITRYFSRANGQWDVPDDAMLHLAYAPSLQYLIATSNLISQIAPDAFLGNEALIHIDLSHNRISVLEKGTFNNLLRLENVLLDSNKLKKINYRAFVNLPNLKIISLKSNLITDIDEDVFAKLDSRANEIQLFLDDNKIHTLRSGSFRGITGLKHIGLSNNRIKAISSQAFMNLPNLESLVIENQYLDEIPDRTDRIIESDAFFNLSNLASLTIRGNVFAKIQAQAFHRLPSLTILDLSNNSIEYLSSVAFYDLPIVENLYLEDNFISNIEPGIFPRQLKQLNLAWNPLCKNFSCCQIEDLYQLEKINVSGIIEHFKIDDVAALPANLTVIVGSAKPPSE